MNYNRVVLTYDIVLLAKQIQLRSLYTGSHTANQQGATMESSLSVTDAELDLVYFNLRDAANVLYQKLQALTRNSEVPFQYDYLNPTTQKRNITYELWLNENWDAALSPALNLAGEKILVNYCLRDWYATTGQQIAFQMADLNFNNAEKELRQVTDSRKTPIRRPYTYL